MPMRNVPNRLLIPSTLLALAAVSAGCVDDATELYSEEGELVGGTATTARPEIGSYVFPNGGGGWSSCTATLIGPRTVLTAAHCMVPQYTGTSPGAGAVFMFTDVNGFARNVGVDRVHSFATKRFEQVPGTPFTTDLMVLHLVTPVPASQASPAALAIQEPYNGEQATIFGNGCTDRTPQSGGGFKQFFTFTVGNATTALCWGDSGGPVVAGSQTGGGAVWGVNSDFNVGWDVGWFFPDGWTDLFADVPFYRKQIESVVRGWDGANEQGVNRPGLDYQSFVSSSAATCRVACEADGNCRAFTWVPEYAAGRCWLKSGAPEPVPGAGMVSGLPSRLELNTNRYGGDYAGVWAPSAEACAATCGRDQACAAFTYEGSNCWLKSSVPATSTCTTCTSGVPRRGLELGVNRPGYDIAVHTAGTARQCATLCAQNERCEAYTHTSAASSNCWLKEAVPGAGAGAGMTSGVRRGIDTNTDRWGGDYRTLHHPPSPAFCQATCARESQCQAWAYAPPPSNGNDATCYLKSSVPGRYARTGYVSGIKGLEMVL